MALYTAAAPNAANAAFWARFRQIDTDVTRLLRQVADIQNLPQLQFGSPDFGAAGVTLRAQLQQRLTNSQSASATLLDSGATITVHGDQWRGYGFPGDRIDVRRDPSDNRWYASGAGHTYCTGTLSSTLSKNGFSTITVQGNSVLVYGQWGGTSAGTIIGALWNEMEQRWDAALEACES